MTFSRADIEIGIAVLVVAFVVVPLLAGAFSLPVPQWSPAAIAAAVGVVVCFAMLRRREA